MKVIVFMVEKEQIWHLSDEDFQPNLPGGTIIFCLCGKTGVWGSDRLDPLRIGYVTNPKDSYALRGEKIVWCTDCLLRAGDQ